MRRLKLTSRSSEYKNLRHVVPSLRLQRDVGEVEVVTEAARYIDHLHKTLIERFVLCGIPDSLKDVLGTNDANELCSQHIMNLVSKMAANQRQQQGQSNLQAQPIESQTLDTSRTSLAGARQRKSRCHRRCPAATSGASSNTSAAAVDQSTRQLQQHQRHSSLTGGRQSLPPSQPLSDRMAGAQISARDHIKSSSMRRTNLGKIMSKGSECGASVQQRPVVLVKAKRSHLIMPRLQQHQLKTTPPVYVKSQQTSSKLPLQITKDGNIVGRRNIVGQSLQSKKPALYHSDDHVATSSWTSIKSIEKTTKPIVDINCSSFHESHQQQRLNSIQNSHHSEPPKSVPVADSHCTFSMSPVANSILSNDNNIPTQNCNNNQAISLDGKLSLEATNVSKTDEQHYSLEDTHNKDTDKRANKE